MEETLIDEVRGAFEAAVRAADPAAAVAGALATLGREPTAILAVGKAAPAMAGACREGGLPGSLVGKPGLIVTNPENARPVDGFETILGGHPLPDGGSIKAGLAAMEFVRQLGPADHLLVLLSGGGSALMAAPIGDLTLEHKRAVNEALLASGMDIHEMNAVRRLFSSVKGGRLAGLAAPAAVTQWVLSDVAGDRLESIASGPFAADPWTLEDAAACARRARLDRHDWAATVLGGLRDGKLDAPLRPGDEAVGSVETRILASNAICVDAAAEALGGEVLRLPEIEGEAAAMGALLAETILAADHPVRAATGGEAVVTLPEGHGLGGRSQELALAFLLAMREKGPEGKFDWALLAAGTDGRDGPTDAAGGLVTSAIAVDLAEGRAALEGHDSHRYLERIGGLHRCAPTGTNLADIAVVATARRA